MVPDLSFFGCHPAASRSTWIVITFHPSSRRLSEMLRNAAHTLGRNATATAAFSPRLFRIHGGSATHLEASFATKAGTTGSTSSSSDAVPAGKCPFSTVSTSVNASDMASSAARPVLKDVPAVPILGSFIHEIPLIGPFINDNITKLPVLGGGNFYDYQYQLYERFGPFYTNYVPGLGEGLWPKVYTIMDPDEMKKVIRQEGAFPRGGVEGLKPIIKWMKKQGFAIAGPSNSNDDNGFMGRGEEWRRVRNFLQTDLLSPQSANGYVPGVVGAAKSASQGAQAHAKDLNTFFNYCAFDMFQSIMFGIKSELANPNTPSDPIDVEFCRHAVDSLAYLIQMSHDKQEAVMFALGIETELYHKFEHAMDGLKTIVMQKLEVFKERWRNNELNEIERNSYFAHALERQKDPDSNIDEEELMQIGLIMLNASVDTTSTFIGWAMVHLSINDDVQEKLYQELKQNVDQNNGTLSPELLTKAKAPYLHAVLRESHRITPVMPAVMFKSNSVKDIDIHGQTIPKDSLIGFDSYSLGMDPSVVEDPEKFIPERWIDPQQIEARKGTPAEALDSIFFRDPFSQGARRCPGSRVAVNETQVILGQLVLDWKITAPDSVKTYKDVPYVIKTLLVPQLPEMRVEART